MRHRSWIFLILTILFFNENRGCAGEDWSKNNFFSLFGDFVFMNRSHISSRCIVEDSSKDNSQQKVTLADGTVSCCSTRGVCCPPDKCVLSTKDLVKCFGYEPGYRIGASLLFNRDICNCPYYSSVTLSYMNLVEWNATKCRFGDMSLSFPFKNAPICSDYLEADMAKASYLSKFQDVELNYRGYVTPPREDYFSFAGILGFRYINLKEKFNIDFSKNFCNCCETSSYDIDAKNNMYGVQLGGDLQWNPTCNLTWDAIVKVGGFANRVSQSTFLGDYNNTCTVRCFSTDGWKESLVTDVSLSMIYLINTHVMIDIGYQFLALINMGLAPDQIDKNYGCGCNDCIYAKGVAYIQGGFVGVKFGF